MSIDMEKLAQAVRYGYLKEDSKSVGEYLNYTDRDSYVEWRASWKTAYKSTSVTIRTLKHQRKLKNRPAGVSLGEILTQLFRQQNIARSLLVIRAAGKKDSHAKRQARAAAAKETAA